MENEKTEQVVENRKIYTPYELFYDEGLSKTGWAGLLLPLYDEVEKWNKDKTDEEHKFQFSQIKEKFATLQLYNFGATEEQWKRIHMCEAASAHICMICGSPFKVGVTRQGWVTTMCEECAKKEDKICPPDDKQYVFQNKRNEKDVHYIYTKNKNLAIDILTRRIEEKHKKEDPAWCVSTEELRDLISSRYKLIETNKMVDWTLKYDSVTITPIIKIALKLQSIGFKLDKIIEKISSFFYFSRGYVKFFFYHHILKNDKLDKTIFNYHKY